MAAIADTELAGLFDTFTRTAFRLELLAAYNPVSEADRLAAYLAGKARPASPEREHWYAMLAAARAAGRTVQRVHVVASPLTDYLRYECEWGYAYSAQAGEDVRVLDTTERPAPDGLPDHDFWMFDDQQVVVMRYRADGEYVGAEWAEPGLVDAYRLARAVAVAAAVPFADYWAAHPEYHRDRHPDGP